MITIRRNKLYGLKMWFILLLASFTCCDCRKVLIIQPSAGSHLMQTSSIGEALIAQGNEVYTIFNSRASGRNLLNKRIRLIEYDSGAEPIFGTKEYQEILLATEYLGFFEKSMKFKELFNLFDCECRGILENHDLEKKLAAKKFDFVVIDALLPCFYIIPDRLGLPFGVFMAFLPINSYTSLQAQLLVHSFLDPILGITTNTNPFMAKSIRTFSTVIFSMMNIDENYKHISNTSIYDIQKKTKLWLLDATQVLSTPMPFSPNVKNVGGLNVRKPKPLPEGELKRFIDSATNGFILASFGSIAKFIPETLVNLLLETFKALPYKIVWKWDKKTLKMEQVVPPNVLVVNWMPQNDVLGHKNIKAFLTHCGNSGQHEALYNAVPMAGVPLFGDQMFNCLRMDGRFGLHLRVKELTTKKLAGMIQEVVENKTYAENIQKASKIFRDQPMEPRETAAYWIDHVMKHGADHLMSATIDMSWIQILMWDVLFFVCLIFTVLSALCFLMCRCVYWKFCRKSREKVKKS